MPLPLIPPPSHPPPPDPPSRFSRQAVHRFPHAPECLVALGKAVLTCFKMLRHATLKPECAQGFALSKSLQGMSELVFTDLLALAPKGVWPQQQTAQTLRMAADTALSLPALPMREGRAMHGHTEKLADTLRDFANEISSCDHESFPGPLAE